MHHVDPAARMLFDQHVRLKRFEKIIVRAGVKGFTDLVEAAKPFPHFLPVSPVRELALV